MNPEEIQSFLTRRPDAIVPRTVMVVAHPDDEVVGAGAQLARWRPQLVYVTDGSPRNLQDARAAGFNDGAAYAEARRREALAVLARAGIPEEHAHFLGFTDQEVSFCLKELTGCLVEFFRELNPDLVVTQPYEGGHPDHDSVAFAVRQACEILLKDDGTAPIVFESTAYHSCAGIMATSEFLPRESVEITTLVLSPSERLFKRRLFDCIQTQQRVLQYFPIAIERFRPAPRYDFTQPPPDGPLYYETFDWGMRGELWRTLASEAWEPERRETWQSLAAR